MNRASPESLRRSLLAADAMSKAGIAFVPMPAASDAELEALWKRWDEEMDRLALLAEADAAKVEGGNGSG